MAKKQHKMQYVLDTFLFLTLFLLMSIAFSVQPKAAENKVMILEAATVECNAGDTVKIPITIKNNSGITSLKFSVNYDDKLTLENVELSSEFGSYLTAPQPYKNPQVISFISPLKDVNIDGIIATMHFKVSDDVEPGYKAKVQLTYNEDDVFDFDFNNVNLQVVNGGVNIPETVHHFSDAWRKDSKKHWHECTDKGCSEKSDLADHNWNKGTVTKEPTIEQVGIRTFTCTVCNAEKTEIIDKLPTIISVEDKNTMGGRDLIIAVKMKENPGIAGFSLKVNYDAEKLILKEITNGSVTQSGKFETNKNIVNWYTSDNVTSVGDIFHLHFTVKDDLDECDTTVSVELNENKAANFTNDKFEPVNVKFVNGTIYIKKGILGDVTGDNVVAINDVVKLNQAVLGKIQLTDVEKKLGDVTFDDVIAINDVVKLNKFVLGKITSLEQSIANAFALPAPKDTPKIIVDSLYAKAGSNIRIPVRIKNNTGIAGMALEFELPDDIVLNSIEKGELFKNKGVFTVEGKSLSWYTEDNITADGVIAYLNCTVEKVTSVNIDVKVKDNKDANICDENFIPVAVEFEEGFINAAHNHIWDTGKTTAKATLSKNGIIVKNCTVCGAETKIAIVRPGTIQLSKAEYIYNGKVQKPSVIVRDTSGKVIPTSNYTTIYSKGLQSVGKYSVKIIFKNNYTGSKNLTYTIVPKSTAITKLASAKTSFKAVWKKQAVQTTGYQIQYSTGSKFTSPKSVNIVKNSVTSKKITKLKAKKKYFVKMRTYKTVSGVKYYSGWSSVKSVITR